MIPAIGFLILVVLVALFNPFIRPDRSSNANQQNLEIAKLDPFTTVRFLEIETNGPTTANNEKKLVPIKALEFQNTRLKLLVYNTNGIEEYRFYSYVDILFNVNDSVIAKAYEHQGEKFAFRDNLGIEHQLDFTSVEQKVMNEAIVKKHFFLGTDQYGRDLLSRLMAGSRVSMAVGFLSILLALFLGLGVGLVSGYFGGRWDQVFNWTMNVFYSIPALLLVIGITLFTGKGVAGISIGIGLVLWVEMARVIRGEVISLKEKEFVKAARLIGMTDIRIILKHLIPNLSNSLIILSSSNFADAILMEAGLSFLGIGIQPPIPSWGGMIRELYGYIITDGAFLAIVPGIAIFLVVLSFLVVSNGFKRVSKVQITTREV